MDNPIEPTASVGLTTSDLSDSAHLLRGMATATQALLTVEKLDEAINQALACLGQATQVDRVYIFENNASAEGQDPKTSQRWEWVNEGIQSELDNPELQNLSYREFFPRWYVEMMSGRAVHGVVKGFPLSERQILEPQGILSLIVVPIQIEQKFWGFVGLDNCSKPHAWSLTEISTLWSMAGCLGGAIARDARQQRFQAIYESRQESSKPTGQGLLRDSPSLSPQQLSQALAEQRRQTKREFLTSLNRELSLPLQGVLSQAQRLTRTLKLGPEEQQGLALIHQHGSQLLTQIDWMLDLDRLRAKELLLSPGLVHLPAFLQAIAEVCRRDAGKIDMLLVYQPTPQLPTGVIVDGARLQQVLMALLQTAIASNQEGQITLRVRAIARPKSSETVAPGETEPGAAEVRTRLRFSVMRVPGLLRWTEKTEEEETAAAFSESSEMETAPAAVEDSPGKEQSNIALAVAQALVEQMGGNFLGRDWDENSYNLGFELELPVEPNWPQRVLASSRVMGYEGPRKRILIVDDRWENRSLLASLLKPLGFEVCEAADGEQGLMQLQEFQPDLVMTDLVMPVLDGFAMLAEIRAQSEFEELPIIISTAPLPLCQQQRSLDQGGDDCLLQPIQLRELLPLLQKHLHLAWEYRSEDRARS